MLCPPVLPQLRAHTYDAHRGPGPWDGGMGPGPVTRDQAFDDPAAQTDLGPSTEAGMGEPVLPSTALLISCKSKLIHSETGAWEVAGWGPWMPTQKRSGRGKLESLGTLRAHPI